MRNKYFSHCFVLRQIISMLEYLTLRNLIYVMKDTPSYDYNGNDFQCGFNNEAGN